MFKNLQKMSTDFPAWYQAELNSTADDTHSSQTIAKPNVVGSPSLSEQRVIKFRGKRTVDGKWVFGYYIKRHGINEILTPSGTIPVHPWSVSEWSGYTDWNGVDIYENDIISSPNGQIKKALIYFSQATFWYKEWCDFSNDWHHSEMGWCEQYGKKELGILHWSANRIALQVVGNLFDNPELLEGVQ